MHAGWSVSVVTQGLEAQPVVVIDGFAPEPEALVEDASYLAFRSMGEHYPGIRAPVAAPVLRPMLAAIAPIAAATFGAGTLEVVDAFYSLVTTPPSALAPIQRLPHFDEMAPTRLALLHYLARDEGTGTAFFRHRATGFESVDRDRLAPYRQALDADLQRHGLPDPAYIAGDTAVFEQVARHRGRFNRAILYRSNTLHCAAIPPETVLSRDPGNGRLTVNTFLELRS